MKVDQHNNISYHLIYQYRTESSTLSTQGPHHSGTRVSFKDRVKVLNTGLMWVWVKHDFEKLQQTFPDWHFSWRSFPFTKWLSLVTALIPRCYYLFFRYFRTTTRSMVKGWLPCPTLTHSLIRSNFVRKTCHHHPAYIRPSTVQAFSHCETEPTSLVSLTHINKLLCRCCVEVHDIFLHQKVHDKFWIKFRA